MSRRIKSGLFCALSTSSDWQAWLRDFDGELHAQLLGRLRNARGCGENSQAMSWVLGEIQQRGGEAKLVAFLEQQYPHVLEPPPRPKKDWLQDFNTTLLTFPRRHIITGESSQLRKQVHEFIRDKLKSDHIIIETTAYIEYLNAGDASLANDIPRTNWRIAAHRKDN